jgi:hypothetical protein
MVQKCLPGIGILCIPIDMNVSDLEVSTLALIFQELNQIYEATNYTAADLLHCL